MSNSNEIRLNADDPRLTAYALGELDAAEQKQVEAAIASDPALQTLVDEIRAAAAQLATALKCEPLLPPVQPAHLLPYRTVRPARMFAFPYWMVAGLAAAACLVAIVVVHQLQLSDEDSPAKANQLADNSEAAKKSAGRPIVGQPQAYNHVDVVFPPTEGDAKESADSPTDQWGVVVPNAPSNEVAAASGKVTRAAGGSASLAKSLPASAALSAGAPSRVSPPAIADVVGTDQDHAFLPTAQRPLSILPADIDTSGYAIVRRSLLDGRRPPSGVVRLEDLVNYFNYSYPAPKPGATVPFAASLEVASAPWAPLHRLVRIGLKARELPAGEHDSIVARDVSVQVEFNPVQVQSYRLLGYEKTAPGDGNPNHPETDAVDVESGRTITAFYEVVPTPGYRTAETGERIQESGPQTAEIGNGKGAQTDLPASAASNPAPQSMLTVRIRYRAPENGKPGLLEFPLIDNGAAFAAASNDFKFAASVAEFALVLRDSPYKSGATLADALIWAKKAVGPTPDATRREFISMIKRAQSIEPPRG
jgi:hypothetical protein